MQKNSPISSLWESWPVVLGVLSCGLTLLLWGIFWFANPYQNQRTSATITPPGIAMALLAVVGGVAALRRKPRAMLVVALFSVLPVGGYLLGSPGLFRWIGGLNIIYLLSAIGMFLLSKGER